MQTLLPNLQHFFIAATDTLSPLAALSRKFGVKRHTEKAEQKRHLKEVAALNKMAREVELSQPGLAAELRSFTSR